MDTLVGSTRSKLKSIFSPLFSNTVMPGIPAHNITTMLHSGDVTGDVDGDAYSECLIP